MDDLKQHYLNRLNLYGDSPEAVQWSDVKTQEKRFSVLLEIADIRGRKILDYGCGTGHLATYLKQHNINVDYTGVDLVEEFLAIARRKNPNARFGKFSDYQKEKFDYILISGVFNNKIKNNVSYYQTILKNLFKNVNKGIAFNMMSFYVDYYDDNLFYEKPENVFAFVKNNISPYVIIRNDYQVREGIIPFEFCTYIYKR